MSFVMLACDETGSVATMPLVANRRGQAEMLAMLWLNTYDHGFSRAAIVPAEQITPDTSVDEIHALISFEIATGSGLL